MNHEPNIGTRVKVWPHPGLRVLDGPIPGGAGPRWLPEDGREVTWSEFQHRQFGAGEIHLHDPRVKMRHFTGAPEQGDVVVDADDRAPTPLVEVAHAPVAPGPPTE